MVSRELAKLSEDFVMTVGVGDDLVMRVGIDSVEDLRSNMLHVLHACRLPKVRTATNILLFEIKKSYLPFVMQNILFCLQYRIFLNGFGYAFFGVPSRDLESTWKSDRIRTPVFSTKDRQSPLLENGPSTSFDIVPNYFHHVGSMFRKLIVLM